MILDLYKSPIYPKIANSTYLLYSETKTGRKMKPIKCFCLMLSIFLLIIGCSGNNANIRNLPESESKAIKHELLDNWSDYDISYRPGSIIFDPKNDDKKLLIHRGRLTGYYTVKDQETWTQLVNGTIPHNMYNINMLWKEPIREIWVHNQFYGYVIIQLKGHYVVDNVGVRVVDDNTVWLVWH